MRSVVTARSPDQEDYPTLPHAQALQPQLTVALAIVFHRDHRVVESWLQISKINLVLPDVLTPLWFVPGDHKQNVYALCLRVNQTVDTEESARGGTCWCGLTFELSGRRRQDARPGLVKMYRVPPARAWWPAVGAPLERGVRRHRARPCQ
jgi:hypothetical protein